MTLLKQTATKTLALALTASFMLTSALPIAQAEAGQRHWKNDYRGQGVVRHHQPRHYKKQRRSSSSSDALAAGIIGFAIGAIIADQSSRNRTVYVEQPPVYVQPQSVYVQPQPVYRQPLPDYNQPRDLYNAPVVNDYDQPQVIRYEDTVGASYEPWTPAWAEWCDNKYRSFNRNTGTFRGYDGLDHFCVVK
ncbi:MAG: BA14K family protein [Salaquimonas sp.]